MDNSTLVMVVSAAFGLFTAVATTLVNVFLSSRMQQRLQEWQQGVDKASVIANYRDPLLHAVADLQSRLFNILCKDFLGTFLLRGNEREQHYAVENTIFLLTQFLGWTELTRQDLRFVVLENEDKTKRLRKLQGEVYSLLGTDKHSPLFRIFAGEQRALGEFMIQEKSVPRNCMGYGAFLLADKSAVTRWIEPLRADLHEGTHDLKKMRPRLIPLQHAMIDLLDLLDPECVKFPKAERRKIEV